MIRLKVNCFVYLLLILWASSSFALDSDKQQIMSVVADSADLSQQNHKGIYTGHVEFKQGNSTIHAAKAITQGDDKNQLSLAIAQGNKGGQAHYWTESTAGKPPFHAYADTIRYYPLRHQVVLEGNVRIEQGKNSLSAAKITYDTLSQHMVSESKGDKRTTIILYPGRNDVRSKNPL